MFGPTEIEVGSLQAGLITKGVESVPSTVRNLKEWSRLIDHESFIESVIAQFGSLYEANGPVVARVSLTARIRILVFGNSPSRAQVMNGESMRATGNVSAGVEELRVSVTPDRTFCNCRCL